MEDDQDLAEDEYYSDDPVMDPKIDWFYKLRSFAPVTLLLMVTTFFLPSTVGGNLNLSRVDSELTDFAFGISRLSTCFDGGSQKLTAFAEFTNESNSGTHKLSAIRISSVPVACKGLNILLRAYEDVSSMPAPLFGDGFGLETYTVATVSYLSNGYFALGSQTTRGASLSESSTAAFKIVFDKPLSLTRDIAKITVETIGSSPGTTLGFSSLINVGLNGSGNSFSDAQTNGDGSRLIVSTNGNQRGYVADIGEISNYGRTYATAGSSYSSGVYSSDDGKTFVTCPYPDRGAVPTAMYFRKNGTTTSVSTARCSGNNRALFGNSSGTKIYTLDSSGVLYLTTNLGLNFTAITYANAGCPATSNIRGYISGDDTKVVLVSSDTIWKSNANGASGTFTCVKRTNGFDANTTYSYNPTNFSMSEDGSVMAIADETNKKIFLSNDSGSTWVSSMAAQSLNLTWNSVAVSGDGTFLVALPSTGKSLYFSRNFGVSWSQYSFANLYTNANSQLLFTSTPKYLVMSKVGNFVYLVAGGNSSPFTSYTLATGYIW
jgi:hypothetical protein